MFPWATAAEAHAALNDLPPVLFVASVLFDVLGVALRRDSFKAAGFWTLILGSVGSVGAVITGEMAEDTIEHGESIHEAMGRHETLAITVAVLFGVLALWRIWRRGTLGPRERVPYLVLGVLGAGLVTYVAHLGGNIVFRLGGGIPTAVMQEAIEERSAGHHHHAGEPDDHADDHDHDHGAAAAVDSAASKAHPDSARKDHVDPPGAPPHKHD
ncbi:MAG TPA: DUF2231 domain-containing protein [Gemmatimonadales bacterium]|jgi:uncharacterized membrane protein